MEQVSLIMQLLNNYDRARKRYQQRLREEGWPVTGPQVGVLRIVNENPGICISLLAQKMRLHVTTAEGYAKRLSRKGFLEIQTAAEDRRKKLLNVTERGAEIIRNVPLGFKSLLFNNLKTKASPEEKEAILKGLWLLLQYMEEEA